MGAVDTIDENGMDMATLSYRSRGEDVSIGTGEFPSRLSLSRSPGFNIDISLRVINSGAYLVGEVPQLEMKIGSIRRSFSGSSASNYYASDGHGGEIRKTTESGTSVYTYYSTDGEELRFVVANAAACGRSYMGTVIPATLTCAKISKWTAANGVYADFTYTFRSEFVGQYKETDVTSVTNNIGLKLALTYTAFHDDGHYSDPDYEITTATASSDQAGACGNQATCSRTATYGYTPIPAFDRDALNLPTNTDLNSITDTLGQTTQYLRNTPLNTNLTWQSIRKPSNPGVDAVKVSYGTYNYASGGYPSAVLTDAAGSSWTYSRTGTPTTGFVSTRTDPLGKSRVYTFDAKANLISFRDEMLKVTQWQYDGVGRKIGETRPNGGITQWNQGAKWDIGSSPRIETTTIKAAPASPAADIVTSKTYQSSLLPGGRCSDAKVCYKPVLTVDARGYGTTYSYGASGDIATVTSPEHVPGQGSPRLTHIYGVFSGVFLPVTISTCRTWGGSCNGYADETKATMVYGANFLPTQTTLQSGDGALQATTTNTYDAFGNRTSQDGPLPGAADTVRWIYDRAGKVIGEIGADPDGAGTRRRVAKRYGYDADGRQTLVELGTVPNAATDLTGFTASEAQQTAYNANGQKVQETALGAGVPKAVTQYSYDVTGKLDCAAVRMNPDVFSLPMPSACYLNTTGSAGPDRITKYGYDDAGRLTKVTAAYGTSSQIDEVTQDYGDNGKLAHVTDAKGNTTTYGYDGFDRLTTTTFPGGSYEQLGYDPSGNVTSKRTRDGQVTTMAYDELNRLVSKDLPNTVSGETDKSYAYDNLGHLTQAQDSNGRVLTFGYDALGRKTSQGDNSYGMGNATFAYDAAGRLTRLTWADTNYVNYEYRYTGELSAIRNGAGTALVSFGYDDLGRRTSISRANGTQSSFAYDSVSQLGQVVQDLGGSAYDLTIGLSRNAAGQIVRRESSNGEYAWGGYQNGTRTYDANVLNQITGSNNPASGSTTYGYSSTGNLNSASGPAGYESYTYTVANQMVAAAVPLAHDPLERLYRGVLDYGRPDTALLFNGVDVIAEVDQASGATLRRYVQGQGVDEPLIWYEGSDLSNPRYLHADERGSVIAVTDSAGNKFAINSYDDYGLPGTGNTGRFQYTGQKWLSNVGVYDYKARIYSPVLGRFMQTDPIGYGDSLNLYAYVGNDPINGTDPTGLCESAYALCYDAVLPGSSNGGGNDGSGGGYWGWSPFRDYGAGFDFSGFNGLWALRPRQVVTAIVQPIKQWGKNLWCLPAAWELGGEGAAYVGAGIRFSGALAYNTQTGDLMLKGSFGGGIGLGGGASAGVSAQSSDTKAGSRATLQSRVAGGAGWAGFEANYNYVTKEQGKKPYSQGASGAIGAAKAFGEAYIAPLEANAEGATKLGNLGTICK